MKIVFKNPDKIFTGVFHKLNKVETRFCLCFGGSGSSKSYSMHQKIILDSFTAKYDFLIIRKTGNTLKKSVFEGIKQRIISFKLHDYFEFRFSNENRTITNTVSGKQMVFMGLDDPEKIKSIENINTVFVEEANQLTLEDFLELNRRVRGKPDIKIYLLFNPVSSKHWLKKHFIDNPEIAKKTTIINVNYKDNPFLNQDDINELESLKNISENDYRIYCLGQWGIAEGGLVFKPNEWKVVESIPVGAEKLPSGMDFGFSNSVTALVECYLYEGELYYDCRLYKKGLTTAHNSQYPEQNSLQKEFENLNISKTDIIIADSANPSAIRELRLLGYFVKPAKKIAGSRAESLKIMKQYFKNITARSVEMIDEFENLEYLKDKDGNYTDEPEKVGDHAYDAARYSALTKNKLWG